MPNIPSDKSRRGGPPLNALRAFESAARLGSFVLASNELCVTPAAVAQQIKSLENWTGVKLFDRQSKGVSLTAAGKSVCLELVDIFDQLGETVQKLRAYSSAGEVQIAALPSIAHFWLSPLLPEVRKQFPDTPISVIAIDNPPNMKRELIDISLYYDDEPAGDQDFTLEQDIIFPVCAPALLDTLHDSARQYKIPLFHDSSWLDDWEHWLAHSDELQRHDTRGPVFSLYSLAIEEVKNGAGIMIGHKALVDRLIKSGELVKPFQTEVRLQRWLSMKLSNAHKVNPLVDDIAAFMRKHAKET